MLSLLKGTVFAVSLIASQAFADVQLGRHYKLVEGANYIGDKIKIEEIFWYGCGHCNNIEQIFKDHDLKKAEDVEFNLVPATFSRAWKSHANLFYTLKALNLFDELHYDVLNEIHVKKHRLLGEKEQAKYIANNSEYSEDIVRKVMKSFSVVTNVKKADKIVNKYQPMGVPYLVVNETYELNTAAFDNIEGLVDGLEEIVESIRQGRDLTTK